MNEASAARYVVGIDLGTTNTVLAYADSTEAFAEKPGEPARPRIALFPIPQLIAPGEVDAKALLPSFRYHPADGELGADDLRLSLGAALPAVPDGVVGTLAQRLGAKVPGRLVASAKSWLCHPAVDRTAPILPWGAPEGVPKLSPVDASASYLAHLRGAWNAAHPDAPLEAQEVVLTVPASFDEAGRALTLQAAVHAGLPRVRLLEEPQAAFYDYLDRHGSDLAARLEHVQLALVVDVGGGTTDLTLIAVEQRQSGPRLTRIAVGDHLMLGGDNMDVTLARLCEPRLSGAGEGRLPASRFAQLVQQCREAKESLLGEHAPEHAAVTLLGTGSKLIGGKISTQLTRDEVERAVVDGFFPVVGLDARPDARRSGLVEFGLPYAADPVITKHITSFLARHRKESALALRVAQDAAARDAVARDAAPQDAVTQDAVTQDEVAPHRATRDAAAHDAAMHDPAGLLPDAVLLNGGVFRAERLRSRLLAALGALRGKPLLELDNPEPEVAVARGAVAYGLARRGIGLKIGGGSPRSYYLLVEAEQGTQQALCILPRGAEEGEAHTLRDRTFALRIGKPVRFRVFSSTAERPHRTGDLVTLGDDDLALPDIAAVIEGKPGEQGEIPVALHAELTEVGTLEMHLAAVGNESRSYQLEFQLRREQGAASSVPPARVSALNPRFREAAELIQIFYGKASKQHEERKLSTLRPDLEKLLGERSTWDPPLLRELFGELLSGARRRRRSADHERQWFHLVGYTLRPGFGYPIDEWRVDQLFALYAEGIQFAGEAAVFAQWWIMWRRVAGGLDAPRQEQVFSDLEYYLDPEAQRKKRTRPKGPKAQALEDMVRLAGSLERVGPERKEQAGEWLLARLDKRELSAASVYWSLGRLGARAPFHGSAHSVISIERASAWLTRILKLDLAATEQAAFAAAQLARLTNDRARDLAPELRERAAQALTRVPGSEPWAKLIREGGELSEAYAERVIGDSLPPGLRLL